MRHPLTTCLLLLSGPLAAAELPPPAAYSHEGRTYFGMFVAAPEAAAAPRALDVLVVVDRSASQQGPAAQATTELTERIADGLLGGSRVAVVACDADRRSPAPQPAAVGSEALRKNLAEIADLTPSGRSDLAVALDHIDGWLAWDAGLPRAVLMVGDGRSTAGRVADDRFAATRDRLVAARVPLCYVPVGPDLDLLKLQRLAATSGGRLLRPTDADADPATFAARVLAALELRPTYGAKLVADSDLLPTHLPPLRGDAPLLVVGRTAADAVQWTLTGDRDGAAVRATGVAELKADPADDYLPALYASWAKVPAGRQPVVFGAGALRTAAVQAGRETQFLVAQGQAAAQSGQLDRARQLFTAVQDEGVGDSEAETALAALDAMRQPPSAEAPAPAVQASVPDPAETDDLIDRARQLERIESQRLAREVRDVLQTGRELSREDPGAALVLLKDAYETVGASIDVAPDTVARLQRQIETQLRNLTARRRQFELERLERDRRASVVDARRRLDAVELRGQAAQKRLTATYAQLLQEHDYGQARLVAGEIVAQAGSVDQQLAASAAALHGAVAQRWTLDENIEQVRENAWWDTLYSVETSSIPFDDRQVVVFPPVKVWEELTERRKKYEVVDIAPLSPVEERIRDSLSEPVSFNFLDTPLEDVAAFLRQYVGVNVILDKRGLSEANVDVDEPVTLQLDGISFKSALKLILDDLDLTYVIEDEVLKITSKISAEGKFTTRVYPVLDLITPIPDLNSGGVGLGGAMGGGNQGQGGLGGVGGGGGGGLGGGGLGGGGALGGGGGGGGFGGGGGGGLGGGGGGGFGGGGGIGGDLSEELRQLIIDTIRPDSWEDNGGDGSISIYGRGNNGGGGGGGLGGGLGFIRQSGGNEGGPPVAPGGLGGLAVGKPPAGADGASAAVRDAGPLFERHFARVAESPAAVEQAVQSLARGNQHDTIASLLTAYSRRRAGTVWTDQARAISLHMTGAPAADVRAAALSVLDRHPDGLVARLGAAALLMQVDQPQTAVQVLRETAASHPGSVDTLLLALEAGEAAGDLDALAWAADRLLADEWAGQNGAVHDRTRQRLAFIEARLRSEGDVVQADRLAALAAATQVRDLEIVARWDGVADVDLQVVEPGDLLCSYATPQTVHGGVLVSDGARPAERYVAATAYAGDYDVFLRRVWGQPTAGRVTLDIVRHRGTPQERRSREILDLTGEQAHVRIRLEEGRRTAPSPLTPALVRAEVLDDLPAGDDARARLRRMVGDGGDPDGGFGGGRGGRFAQPGAGFGGVGAFGGAVGFDPVITVLNDGLSLTVSAVVSADRRYVRLTTIPVLTAVQPRSQVDTVTIGGTAGGGF